MKSVSTSLVAASLVMTALQTLRAGIGKDKTERHAFIVSSVATVIALALCKAPPKGFGSAADHAKLAETFAGAGLKAYAEHCAAFPQALKGRMRSLEWAEAQEEGAAITVAAFAGCAPRTVTPEAQAAKDVKKAARKVEAEKEEKAAIKAAKEAEKDARQIAFDEGRASVVITPTMVADLIKAGAFKVETVLELLGYEVTAPAVEGPQDAVGAGAGAGSAVAVLA